MAELRLVGLQQAGMLRGGDDRGGAREAQVATMVIEALHLAFAGFQKGLALINV